MRWPLRWAVEPQTMVEPQTPIAQPAPPTSDRVVLGLHDKIEQLRELRRGDGKVIDQLRGEIADWRARCQQLRDELHRARQPAGVRERRLAEELVAARRDRDQAVRAAAVLDERLAHYERRPTGAPHFTRRDADATQALPTYRPHAAAEDTRLLPGWRVGSGA